MSLFKDFVNGISDSLLDQVGLAENEPGNLDFKGRPYGRIGEIANRIDTTAHRSYVESGAVRNIRPRASEILMQEPDVTVVIKKRFASSLAESYRVDYMDEDDKLFLRASKRLFYNKIRVISAYERLSKFERLSKKGGIISDYALPFVFNAFDTLANSPIPQVSSLVNNETRKTLETIRKVKRFSDPQFFTTWNIAEELPYAVETGEGTGTFDLTLVSSFSVTNSVNWGGGNASLTIEDPYKLMTITNRDIEQAISDAVNFFKNNNFFRLSKTQLERATNDLKDRLNQIRAVRGASPIFFLVREDTVLFRKVRAIIDNEGVEIDFRFDGGFLGSAALSFPTNSVTLPSSSTLRPNSLSTPQEQSLFKQIINNLYLLIGLDQTTRSESVEYNQRTNYIRKKMDLHYSGKFIIQPMDVVSIFATGNTITDSKVTQGLKYNYIDNSIINNINDTLGNIENTLGNIKDTFSGGGSANSALEQEKNAIAGPSFPLWLYSFMQNDFTRQSNGTCIFNGLCVNASRSYNNGKYQLSISCKDNSHYFDLSQLNVNPSVDVFNSALLDPLTPFKNDFDESSGFLRGEIPELLEPNKRLLTSKSIKAKLGPFRGSPLDQSVFSLPDVENIQTGRGYEANNSFSRRSRNKFYSPDGFVYRWKEGIGSLVLFGEPFSPLDSSKGPLRNETSPNITQNPFAGQDVMNVISLLITGQPYSFNNFVRGAVEFGKLQRQDLTNNSLSNSFFKGLIQQITERNAIWGSFIPFKKLVINEDAYQFLSKGQFDLTVKNERLNDLIARRAKAFDDLTTFAPEVADSPQNYRTLQGGNLAAGGDPADATPINRIVENLNELDREIREAQRAFEESISNVEVQTEEGTLGIFGNDISFDPTVVGLQNQDNETKRREARKELRDRINFLTRRRIWKVRANEDPNLFIVDDVYDKNYDIQAFELALSNNLELFNSTYATPFDKIRDTASTIGLEVFADSQGHIQARPPQYNRMPSRVFRDLIQRRAIEGIQIFPEYLERLFFTTTRSLIDRIEIIEDKIRLKAAALGRLDDDDVVNLLSSSTSNLGSSGTFKFLTSRDRGVVASDIRLLFDQDDPELLEARNSKALSDLSDIVNGPLNATVNFNVISKITAVQDQESFQGDTDVINNEIAKISSRLEQRTNERQPSNLQAVLSNNRVINITGRRQTDVLRVSNEISQLVTERQRIIKRLGSSLKSLREGLQINDPSSNSLNSILRPNISGDSDTPEIIEHMLQDENIDDYGYNSGKRFVIEDSQIINYTVEEKPPQYNMVQVDGRLAGGLTPLPSSLSVSGGVNGLSGGNGLATAWAVDYDTWRMYGWRAAHSVTTPFFSNPFTQCAPYAVFLLNLYRKNIFQANCSVVGNEYMQAGEVYYIEDDDLLFYAEAVTHNFTYNSNFETRLTLTYGHTPGEYIPTHLDIIGKGLYSNRHQAELVRNVRHGRVDDSNHIGTIIFDNSVPISGTGDALKALVSGNFAEQNKQSLTNMLLIVSGLLTPTDFGKVLTIEIRRYQNSDPEVNLTSPDIVRQVSDAVRQWIIDPSNKSFNDGETLIPTSEDPPRIDPSRVSVELVDLDPAIEEEIRSPSNLAWSAARSLVAASNIPIEIEPSITAQQESAGETGDSVDEGEQQDSADKQLADLERRALVKGVIDIWVTYVDPDQVAEGSKQPPENNQAAQQEQSQVSGG